MSSLSRQQALEGRRNLIKRAPSSSGSWRQRRRCAVRPADRRRRRRGLADPASLSLTYDRCNALRAAACSLVSAHSTHASGSPLRPSNCEGAADAPTWRGRPLPRRALFARPIRPRSGQVAAGWTRGGTAPAAACGSSANPSGATPRKGEPCAGPDVARALPCAPQVVPEDVWSRPANRRTLVNPEPGHMYTGARPLTLFGTGARPGKQTTATRLPASSRQLTLTDATLSCRRRARRIGRCRKRQREHLSTSTRPGHRSARARRPGGGPGPSSRSRLLRRTTSSLGAARKHARSCPEGRIGRDGDAQTRCHVLQGERTSASSSTHDKRCRRRGQRAKGVLAGEEAFAEDSSSRAAGRTNALARSPAVWWRA